MCSIARVQATSLALPPYTHAFAHAHAPSSTHASVPHRSLSQRRGLCSHKTLFHARLGCSALAPTTERHHLRSHESLLPHKPRSLSARSDNRPTSQFTQNLLTTRASIAQRSLRQRSGISAHAACASIAQRYLRLRRRRFISARAWAPGALISIVLASLPQGAEKSRARVLAFRPLG